jgi:hypothetical protein
MVILENEVAALQKLAGNKGLLLALHAGFSPKQRIAQAIIRTLKTPILSPILRPPPSLD